MTELFTCKRCGDPKGISNFDVLRKRWRRKVCKKCQRGIESSQRATPDYRRKRRETRNHAREADWMRSWRQTHKARNLILKAKARATRKGLPFDLDNHSEDLQRRIDAGRCELTGITFESGLWLCPTLDRIKPELGYVYANVRVVCRIINCALGDWGEAVLEKVVGAWLCKKYSKIMSIKHPDDGKHVVVQGGQRVSEIKPTLEAAQQEADRLNKERQLRESGGAPQQPPAQVKQNLYG